MAVLPARIRSSFGGKALYYCSSSLRLRGAGVGRPAVVAPKPRLSCLCQGMRHLSTTDKGVMDRMDELLTKIDILLEGFIGYEIEFLGAPASFKITSAPSANGHDRVVLTLAEVVKVDHRLAARMVSAKSAYRIAFETVLQKALSVALGVEARSVNVLSIEDAYVAQDSGRAKTPSDFVKGALAAGGGNPALATATLAAWITGARAGGGGILGNPEQFAARLLVVRCSVELPQSAEAIVVSKLESLAATPSLLGDHFRHTFTKGALGKLSDVFERSDSILRRLEPRLDPGFETLGETLRSVNDVLERSGEVLKRLEPNVDPAFEDMRGTLGRLSEVLERSDRLLRRSESGLDTAIHLAGDTMGRMDGFMYRIGGTLTYLKFALLGIGVCGFSVAYAIFKMLGQVPVWDDTLPSGSTVEVACPWCKENKAARDLEAHMQSCKMIVEQHSVAAVVAVAAVAAASREVE